MTAPAISPAKPHEKGAGILRLIGLFKLLKGLALVAAAIATLHLMHRDMAQVVLDWTSRLHIAPGNVHVHRLLVKMMTIDHRQLELLATILAIYAALFITEGIGLLCLQHWAEWMTVITTAGLIPLELFEIFRHPEEHALAKLVTFIINVAVLVYLIRQIRRPSRSPA